MLRNNRGQLENQHARPGEPGPEPGARRHVSGEEICTAGFGIAGERLQEHLYSDISALFYSPALRLGVRCAMQSNFQQRFK